MGLSATDLHFANGMPAHLFSLAALSFRSPFGEVMIDNLNARVPLVHKAWDVKAVDPQKSDVDGEFCVADS